MRDEVRKIYELWSAIRCVISSEDFYVMIAARSAALIGIGQSKHYNIRSSPTGHTPILLPLWSVDDIQRILCEIVGTELDRQVAEMLHECTGGVPRQTTMVASALREELKARNMSMSIEEIHQFLRGPAYVALMEANQNNYKYTSREEGIQSAVRSLLMDSLLKLPVNLNARIRMPGGQKVTIHEVMYHAGAFYYGTKEEAILRFPDYMLYYWIQEQQLCKESYFPDEWHELSEKRIVPPLIKGIMMEDIVVHALLGEFYHARIVTEWCQTLSQTPISSYSLQLNKGTVTLPKATKEKKEWSLNDDLPEHVIGKPKDTSRSPDIVLWVSKTKKLLLALQVKAKVL
jgi:hypothetical protein